MISRRDFVHRTGLSFATMGGATAVTARRPNLLFIFSDQHSADMLGCYGNRQVQTPELDRFAAQGVRFNHCISNSPLCTPYRGLLLSGQHPLRSAALENDYRMLSGGGAYFGEVLRDAGYRTGYVGKWHLYGGNRVRPIPPGPFRYGFDGTFLSNNCTVVYDKERAYYWDEYGERQLYGDWEPYAQSRQAMQFLDQNVDHPFALFVSWHPPHDWAARSSPTTPADSYGAPADLLKLYNPDELQLRANCADTPVARRLYQGYMAMISSVDRAFGWLMKKLEDKGLADNTIVVFTSDHGDTALSHGLRFNKMRPEIESIRVPLLIRYPAALKARSSELLIGGLDLMPTLLSMMGLTPPRTCQGLDLADAIVKAHDNEVESVPLFLLPLDWRGVYTRRHTYCLDTCAGDWPLYRQQYFTQPSGLAWNCLWDHEHDRWEQNNLYDSPKEKHLRDDLHEQTLTWMTKFEDQGLPYETIARAVYSAGDLAIVRTKEWRTRSGIPKGPPLDLLRAK
jgi:arylsulfatase A-like enzyme